MIKQNAAFMCSHYVMTMCSLTCTCRRSSLLPPLSAMAPRLSSAKSKATTQKKKAVDQTGSEPPSDREDIDALLGAEAEQRPADPTGSLNSEDADVRNTAEEAREARSPEAPDDTGGTKRPAASRQPQGDDKRRRDAPSPKRELGDNSPSASGSSRTPVTRTSQPRASQPAG